jgi:hypothetical protein
VKVLVAAQVIVLGITTVGFAGSTLYFASRLNEARSQVMPEPPHPTAVLTVPAASRIPDHQLPASRADLPREGIPRALSEEQRNRKALQQVSTAFMRQYDDPLQRAEMLLIEKGRVRRTFRPFGQLAGMSNAQMDAFINLLAEQRMERSIAEYRCGMSDSCDYDAYRFPDGTRQTAEIVALIGADRYQKYRRFREAGFERGVVENLRVRLVDAEAPLRSSDAERLIGALFEERELFFAQAQQKGIQLTMIGIGNGMVIARADERGGEPEVDDHSREFNEIARTRAATILTQEQLRVFRGIQDEAYRIAEESQRREKAGAR